MLAAGRGEQAVQRRQEPFVPVAVIYRSERSRDAARAAADLEAIRELGFNSVRVPLEWAASEPARGTYDFEALNETLALAGQQGLRVSVRLDVAPLPGWLLRRHPDGRFVPESKSGTAGPARACLDHPGVRADVEAYVAAATANAARHAAWQAIDLGSDLPDGFCRCPHTERRFREWLTAALGSEPRQPSSAASDRAAFVALQRADHLALLTAAASARGTHSASSSARAPSILRHLFGESPGQDDWLMTTVVDHYGTAVPPETGSATSLVGFAAGAGARRPAIRGTRQGLADDRRRCRAARAADLRLMTWAALSRGARGVTYGDGAQVRRERGLVGGRTITDRARRRARWRASSAATRRSSRPLRPRPAKIAIVYDPRLPGQRRRARSPTSIASFFERNTRSTSSISTRSPPAWRAAIRWCLPTRSRRCPRPAGDALKAYVAAGGTLITARRRRRRDRAARPGCGTRRRQS